MVPCMHAFAQHILAASVVLERRACAQSHFGARCIAVARTTFSNWVQDADLCRPGLPVRRSVGHGR
eukprot:14034374-Alexandrium_andersonii.AAC.1